MIRRVSPWQYLDTLRADPRIRVVSDDRLFDDGVHLFLADGYDSGDVHTPGRIHEFTVKDLRAAVACIRKVAP